MYIMKDIQDIIIPLLKHNFPNYDGLRTASRMGRITIDVRITEANYIGDLLTCEMNFEDIGSKILEELYDLGCDSVEVRKTQSTKEFSFNRSAALAC